MGVYKDGLISKIFLEYLFNYFFNLKEREEKEDREMERHIFFSKKMNSKEGLIRRLKKRLNYRNITVSNSELRGYSEEELKMLLRRYEIYYNYRIYERDNMWYR